MVTAPLTRKAEKRLCCRERSVIVWLPYIEGVFPMAKPIKGKKHFKIGDETGAVSHIEGRHRKPPKAKEADPGKLNPKVIPKQKQSTRAFEGVELHRFRMVPKAYRIREKAWGKGVANSPNVYRKKLQKTEKERRIERKMHKK